MKLGLLETLGLLVGGVGVHMWSYTVYVAI